MSKVFKILDEIHLNMEYKSKRIALSSNDGVWVVCLKDIIRIEGNGNYSKFFFTNEEPLLLARHLKEFESLLFAYKFERIHKSHLINLQYIKRYYKGKRAYIVLQDGTTIYISRSMNKRILECLPLI